MTSSTCGLQASLSFNGAKIPVEVLQWIWNLSQCVQSIINSQKWLFSLRKWICAHLSNASNNEGFKAPEASSNFKCEKHTNGLLKCLWKHHQWTQNVQKPLAGLLQHLIWSKTPKVMASAIFPLQALQPVRHSAPVGEWNLALSVFVCINPAHSRPAKCAKMSNR